MKTGRNDNCPCGSGKKYKKCCLKTMESTGKKSSSDASTTFKNTKTAHLEITDKEIKPNTLMKDSGFPNAKYFSEDAIIIKDMTPNTYDYVGKRGYDLCYNGGRILSNLGRMYDDKIDKIYAVFDPREGDTPYKVLADIYVSGHNYHEICSIASFRKKDTLMKWLETPVGDEDIDEYALILAKDTEPIEEDSKYGLNPLIVRGYRKIRELFAEKYPNNEKFSDEKVEDLFEEFKYDMYFKEVRNTIDTNERMGLPREFRVIRDTF